MVDSKPRRASEIYLWPIRFIGLIFPRRLRADWRQERGAEPRYRGMLVAVRLLAKRIRTRLAMSSRLGANKHTASSAWRPSSVPGATATGVGLRHGLIVSDPVATARSTDLSVTLKQYIKLFWS